jgi:hypothetical protein
LLIDDKQGGKTEKDMIYEKILYRFHCPRSSGLRSSCRCDRTAIRYAGCPATDSDSGCGCGNRG